MNEKIDKSLETENILCSTEDKLKMLDITVKLFDRECDRLWKRYSALLAVNAICIALLKFSQYNPYIYIIAGLFGLFLCYCWNKIMIISRYYEVRWQLDMIEIIESDACLKYFLCGRKRETSRVSRPFPQSSSFYSRLIIGTIAVVWVIILISGITLKLF